MWARCRGACFIVIHTLCIYCVCHEKFASPHLPNFQIDFRCFSVFFYLNLNSTAALVQLQKALIEFNFIYLEPNQNNCCLKYHNKKTKQKPFEQNLWRQWEGKPPFRQEETCSKMKLIYTSGRGEGRKTGQRHAVEDRQRLIMTNDSMQSGI